MNRINACFDAIKKNNKKALIPFITAGDPSSRVTVSIMHELVLAGSDIIELGVPFSDPMADGPIIQRASERALAQGTNTDDVFKIVEEFRGYDEVTPIILMGYLNPIEIMGYKKFVDKAAKAGVDGLIVVDLPPEEAEEDVLRGGQRSQGPRCPEKEGPPQEADVDPRSVGTNRLL